jgi:triphosphoribosyl-dephospho-CoA synthase
MPPYDDAALARALAAFLNACRLDVETAKPGNVSVDSPGHGMTASQFIASADVAAGALFKRGAPVGERILDAVRRTRDAAGCNTNLGIVLLVAPLAAALERASDADAPPARLVRSTRLNNAVAWRNATEKVLASLSIDDARAAYKAIALANPGGLGDAPEQSVHAPPSVNLRTAMALAAERDSIARQYANGFADVFEAARHVPQLTLAATLDVFLAFLSRFPDSHIVRKHGAAVAQSVTDEARQRHDTNHRDMPRASPQSLIRWDAELKAAGINPGTSADLTVATLFVAGITSVVGVAHGAR